MPHPLRPCHRQARHPSAGQDASKHLRCRHPSRASSDCRLHRATAQHSSAQGCPGPRCGHNARANRLTRETPERSSSNRYNGVPALRSSGITSRGSSRTLAADLRRFANVGPHVTVRLAVRLAEPLRRGGVKLRGPVTGGAADTSILM